MSCESNKGIKNGIAMIIGWLETVWTQENNYRKQL